MKIFKGTKNLKNILKGLKLNVGIFRKTIYLFNPKKKKLDGTKISYLKNEE